MGRNYNEKSILKTKVIKSVLENEKDYVFQDFKFKVVKAVPNQWGWKSYKDCIEVYNFDTLILKIEYDKYMTSTTKGISKTFDKPQYQLWITYFNAQTNNDCQSINHIIATFSEMCENQHEDRGNASLINNQYIFRRKDNFYSYTKVWIRGEIKYDNYNKELSHEFATEEYINHIKKIFNFTRMPRRNLKGNIKKLINKAVSTENKRLIVQTLEKSK
jgi:hypothetical protein